MFSLTVVAENDADRAKSEKMKAGNNGVLSYKPLDTNKVEI